MSLRGRATSHLHFLDSIECILYRLDWYPLNDMAAQLQLTVEFCSGTSKKTLTLQTHGKSSWSMISMLPSSATRSEVIILGEAAMIAESRGWVAVVLETGEACDMGCVLVRSRCTTCIPIPKFWVISRGY